MRGGGLAVFGSELGLGALCKSVQTWERVSVPQVEMQTQEEKSSQYPWFFTRVPVGVVDRGVSAVATPSLNRACLPVCRSRWTAETLLGVLDPVRFSVLNPYTTTHDRVPWSSQGLRTPILFPLWMTAAGGKCPAGLWR